MLIIDDDPKILSLIRELLEEEDFMAITAANSDEAVEKARKLHG